MSFADLALVTSRVLLILLCGETAVRYALWYRKIRDNRDAGLLGVVILGLAVVQFGVAVSAGSSGVLWTTHDVAVASPAVLMVLLGSNVLILIGTALHLSPAWRIAYGYRARRASVAIAVRCAVSVVLTAAFLIARHLAP